jgi:hypothetical protein
MLACTLGPACGARAANDAPIEVKLNVAKVVRLPAGAQTLIVGNPIIADVTLLHGGSTMVVTGKGYGETNLIVLDHGGAIISEARIRVQQATDSLLIVQRGMERESYSCAPRCEPTLELGDNAAYANTLAGAMQARNGLASPQAGK